jgi:hypothetical protein
VLLRNGGLGDFCPDLGDVADLLQDYGAHGRSLSGELFHLYKLFQLDYLCQLE